MYSIEYKIRGCLQYIATRMECKTCGKTTDSESCKSLTDTVFRTLHDLVVEGPVRVLPTLLNQFLAADNCAKRVTYSALTKYGAIKETIQYITSRITSSLQCALWRLFQLRYPHHGAA